MPRGMTYRTDVWWVEGATPADVVERLDHSFSKLGWHVAKTDSVDGSIQIHAEDSSIAGIDLTHYRDPRVARLVVRKTGGGVGVEFKFELNPAYRWFLICASVGVALLMSAVLRIQSGLDSAESSLAGLAGLAILVSTSATLIALLLYSPAYDEVRLKILREVGSMDGATTRIAKSPAFGRGTIIPLWFFFGWVGLEFLPGEIRQIGLAFRESWLFVIGERDEAPLEIVYVVPLILLGFLMVLGATLVLNASDRKGRFAMFSPGLHVGMFSAFYCLIPPFFDVTRGMFPAGAESLGWIATTVILIFTLSYLVFLMVSLVGFHDAYRNWKTEFAFDSSEPEFLPSSKPFMVFALFFWFGLVGFSMLTLYHCASGIEWIVFGDVAIFTNAYMDVMADIVGVAGVTVYMAPVLTIFGLLVRRVSRQALEVVRGDAVDDKTKALIERVCGDVGVKSPRILHLEGISPIVQVGYVFPLGMVLQISKTATRHLKEDQLTAIVAHEAYHLKMHSGLIWILDALSTWTLFGSGFLSMVLDTREWEFEADAHAARYLQDRGLDPGILSSALKRIATLEDYNNRLASSSALRAVPGLGEYERDASRSPKEKLRWVFAVFLGDLILSYIHPTLEERIERIRALS